MTVNVRRIDQILYNFGRSRFGALGCKSGRKRMKLTGFISLLSLPRHLPKGWLGYCISHGVLVPTQTIVRASKSFSCLEDCGGKAALVSAVNYHVRNFPVNNQGSKTLHA